MTTMIMGVGNVLMGDEGVGPRVVELLQREDLPEGVSVVDGGTGGFDLLFEFEGYDRLIVVDAVAFGRPPGTVRVFSPASIREKAIGSSLHGFDLAQVLSLAAKLGRAPETWIVGVQPEKVERGGQLSGPVTQALPRVLEIIRQAVRSGTPPETPVRDETTREEVTGHEHEEDSRY